MQDCPLILKKPDPATHLMPTSHMISTTSHGNSLVSYKDITSKDWPESSKKMNLPGRLENIQNRFAWMTSVTLYSWTRSCFWNSSSLSCHSHPHWPLLCRHKTSLCDCVRGMWAEGAEIWEWSLAGIPGFPMSTVRVFSRCAISGRRMCIRELTGHSRSTAE